MTRATLEDMLAERIAERVAIRLEARIALLTDGAPRIGEWMTVQQAAQAHGVTQHTIRNWIRAGTVEARGKGRARRVRMT